MNMFKKLMNKRVLKNEKGLTLIELLAVIVILAIVAAIAIPAIGNIIENSRYKAVKSDAINIINSANIYFTDNSDKKVVTIKTLVDDKYLDNSGKFDPTSGDVKVVKAGETDGNDKGISISGTSEEISGSKKLKLNKATIRDISSAVKDKDKNTITSVVYE